MFFEGLFCKVISTFFHHKSSVFSSIVTLKNTFTKFLHKEMHSYLQQQLLLVCFLNMNYYYHFCIHNLKRWHAHLILRLAEKCNNDSNFFVDLHILLRLPFLLRMRDFCLLGFCNTLLVVLCAAAAAVLY